MSNISYKPQYSYTAIFEPAAEGGYTATIPALPGCISEGDTFEEAKSNIEEALSLYIDTLISDGKTPPPEKKAPLISEVSTQVSQ